MSYSRRKRFNANPGETILFVLFGESKPHLRVVVTPPAGDPPQVVLVGFTTKRRLSDATVVLSSHHHPFFDRETVANYAYASIHSVEGLMQRIEDGIAEAHEPFRREELKLIQKGILQSRRTPRGIQQYCRKFCAHQCQ